MSTTPRPWFVGYWGGQCRQPHFPHLGAEGGCVYEPIRHEFQQNDNCGCMFAGIGAENGENVLSSTYEGLEITPDNLRFIVRAVNAHDALVGLLNRVEETWSDCLRSVQRLAENARSALKGDPK